MLKKNISICLMIFAIVSTNAQNKTDADKVCQETIQCMNQVVAETLFKSQEEKLEKTNKCFLKFDKYIENYRQEKIVNQNAGLNDIFETSCLQKISEILISTVSKKEEKSDYFISDSILLQYNLVKESEFDEFNIIWHKNADAENLTNAKSNKNFKVSHFMQEVVPVDEQLTNLLKKAKAKNKNKKFKIVDKKIYIFKNKSFMFDFYHKERENVENLEFSKMLETLKSYKDSGLNSIEIIISKNKILKGNSIIYSGNLNSDELNNIISEIIKTKF